MKPLQIIKLIPKISKPEGRMQLANELYNGSKIKYMVEEFKVRRDLIIKLLNQIEGFKLDDPPSGAFYVFPDISSYFGKEIKGKMIENSSDLAMLLLEVAHVATVPGDAFGSPNCLRISYAASRENIEEAVERIKSLLT